MKMWNVIGVLVLALTYSTNLWAAGWCILTSTANNPPPGYTTVILECNSVEPQYQTESRHELELSVAESTQVLGVQHVLDCDHNVVADTNCHCDENGNAVPSHSGPFPTGCY